MKYSVVIVTYNRLQLLKECISCIEKQEKKFDEIVIVDNASTDGTRDWLMSLGEKYNILYETINGGGAKGFKDGVEYTFQNLDTDWILLIDDDAMLSKNYLENIDNFITTNSEYLAVSGTVRTEGKIDITHRKRVRSKLTFSITPVDIKEYDTEVFEYDLSSFCGLLFSAKLIEEIGLPQEEYFIWYDDSEYSLRLRTKTKIVNVNEAWLNHKTKKSSQKDQLNWKGYYGIRNMGDIIQIYGKKSQYCLYRVRVRMALVRNFILYNITKKACYKFNYNLYRDALRDMKNRVFGFNQKYHP